MWIHQLSVGLYNPLLNQHQAWGHYETFCFDTDFTGVPDMFFVSGESTLCSLKVICDVVSLN